MLFARTEFAHAALNSPNDNEGERCENKRGANISQYRVAKRHICVNNSDYYISPTCCRLKIPDNRLLSEIKLGILGDLQRFI